MMQEDIEKAALKYKSGLVESIVDYTSINYEENNYEAGRLHALDDNIEDTFKAGVEWHRNKVWHNTHDTPIKGNHIVVLTKHGIITSWFVSDDIESVFKRFDVVAWAYSNDILPVSFDEILEQNKE